MFSSCAFSQLFPVLTARNGGACGDSGHSGQGPVRRTRPQDRLSDALFRGEVGEIIDYALRLAVDFLLR